MLRIDCEGGSIYVHRNLLCERSAETKEAIEELEEVINSGLSSIDAAKLWPGSMANKRLWELYIGWLYGHPLWTRSQQHNIEEDFEQLALLWDDGRCDGYDPNASDAAMDAIRELVTQHGEELNRPFHVLDRWKLLDEGDYPCAILLDYMVYGQSGRVFAKWYDAYVNGGGSGRLDQGLADRFSAKAKAKSKRRDLPDLMERCRYHLHLGSPDGHCYLDK